MWYPPSTRRAVWDRREPEGVPLAQALEARWPHQLIRHQALGIVGKTWLRHQIDPLTCINVQSADANLHLRQKSALRRHSTAPRGRTRLILFVHGRTAPIWRNHRGVPPNKRDIVGPHRA